jgi:processive 1,2-diacylglycerol beta-glucosyltransferase
MILSSGGGAGHVRAGQALEAACRERHPDVTVAHHDVLEFCGRPTRIMVADLYLEIVNRAPLLYKLFYEKLDREHSRRTQALIRKYDRVAYRTLAKAVEAFDPDEIVCTHFLPAHVMAAKRGTRDGGRGTRGRGVRRLFSSHPPSPAPRPPSPFSRPSRRVSVVLTDYDAHHFWINPAIDRFFAGSDEVRHLLVDRGIPAERVRVSGIPIHPAFSRTRGRAAVARELGIDPDRPTVLLMSGGFGVGNVEGTLERLLSVPGNLQFLVIAGRNEELKRRLERAAASADGRVRVAGFVTTLHDYMEAADVAVTKSGGLTVTECLARGLPMVVVNPIPGQEEMNADWLVEQGAAVKVKHPALLPYKIAQLLGDGQRLGAMKRAARRTARPEAAFDILGACLRGAAQAEAV